MPLPSFKLSDPSLDTRAIDTAETPRWLEDHFSQVNSNNDERILGQVDTGLIKAENVDPSEYCSTPSCSTASYPAASYNLYSYTPYTVTRLNRSNLAGNRFWENSEEDFNDNQFSVQADKVRRKIYSPKEFCDTFYVRLMDILFSIQDEKQAIDAQKKMVKLIDDIETGLVKR